jgi:hypothetical protein
MISRAEGGEAMRAGVVRLVLLLLAMCSLALYLLWHLFEWPLRSRLQSYDTIQALLRIELLLLAVVCAGLLLRRPVVHRGLLLFAIVASLLAFPLAKELPWDRWSLDLDYHGNLSKREAVVKAVADGKISYEALQHRGFIELGQSFPADAHGVREIAIWREGPAPDVYFPVSRGSIDGIAGFYYHGGEGPLHPPGVLPFLVVKSYGEHWYWVEG